MAGAIVLSLTSACEKSEDTSSNNQKSAKASIEVADHTISQNTVVINMTRIPSDGWLVLHADDGNGSPMVPDIISEPVWLMAGDSENVEIALNDDIDIQDGQVIWAMLHMDNGEVGTYEFDGSNGLDGPFMANGSMVMDHFQINSASIEVMNQMVMNNLIVIPKVVAAADGWLVIHNDDGMGGIVLPDIIGKTMVYKGINLDVTVDLDPAMNYQAGQSLFPMLHLDNGQIGVYEFDGGGEFDGPEIFGNDPFPSNVIFTSFQVL